MAVIEHALLHIDPDRQDAFSAAFEAAKNLLESARGFRSVELHRSIDRGGVYLLQVGWEQLDDHLVRFPSSSEGKRFASEIGAFFVTDPIVTHFAAS